MTQELIVGGAELNIVWPQGQTFDLRFEFHDGDETGPLLDLTGCTARMQVRPKPADKDVDGTGALRLPLLDLDSDAKGGLVLDPAGTVTGAVPAEDVALLPSNKTLYYDLELVTATGRVTREVFGTLKFTPEVTR